MPQLDTSTWFITILSVILTLFIIMQLKISKHLYYSDTEPTSVKSLKHSTPWDTKWTKLCLPHSLPLW